MAGVEGGPKPKATAVGKKDVFGTVLGIRGLEARRVER